MEGFFGKYIFNEILPTNRTKDYIVSMCVRGFHHSVSLASGGFIITSSFNTRYVIPYYYLQCHQTPSTSMSRQSSWSTRPDSTTLPLNMPVHHPIPHYFIITRHEFYWIYTTQNSAGVSSNFNYLYKSAFGIRVASSLLHTCNVCRPKYDCAVSIVFNVRFTECVFPGR